MINIEFRVIRTKKDYIVARVDGEYKQHSHHHNRNACYKLISILQKGVMPKSNYLKISASRLLTDEELSKLTVKDKPYYINVNKGVRNG